MIMDGSLTFVVPVRDSRGANNWENAMKYMEMTVERALKQRGPTPHVVLAMSRSDEVPSFVNQANVTVVQVDVEYRPLPTRGAIRTNAVHRDMGERIAQALVETNPKGHIMALDWDDLVSPELSTLVAENPEAPGWKAETGFIFDQGSSVFLIERNMHQYNGSTLVLRRDLAGLVEGGAEMTEHFKTNVLGGHRSALRELSADGIELALMPFHGVAYRRESGENTSVSRSAEALAEAVEPNAHKKLPFAEMGYFTADLDQPVW